MALEVAVVALVVVSYPPELSLHENNGDRRIIILSQRKHQLIESGSSFTAFNLFSVFASFLILNTNQEKRRSALTLSLSTRLCQGASGPFPTIGRKKAWISGCSF